MSFFAVTLISACNNSFILNGVAFNSANEKNMNSVVPNESNSISSFLLDSSEFNSAVSESSGGSYATSNDSISNHQTNNHIIEWNKDGDGISFSNYSEYVFDKPLDRFPTTFECTIKLPTNFNDRAGVVMGNYDDYCACINYEISSNGNPRLYFSNGRDKTMDLLFHRVHVNTGEKIHLTIVNDTFGNLFKCYVNGILTQEVQGVYRRELPKLQMRIGGDGRSGNAQFFKGTIYNVSVFSTARTEQEILKDMTFIDDVDENLIAAFDLSKPLENEINEGIGHKFNLICVDNMWVDSVPEPEGYDFSFAVIGDTQKIVYDWPDKFHNIYDFLLERKETDKISCCIGLGDITDQNSDKEWRLAKEQLDRLNGVIPYIINCGNHDTSNRMNHFFAHPHEFYLSQISCFKKDKVENSYFTIEVGSVKYLIFALDYGARDDALEWASGVINEHPGFRIIVSTHAYLFRDGTTLDSEDVCPPSGESRYNNNGDDIWNKFIRLHNIDLVLCGHDPTNNIVVAKTKNDLNDVVTQMLINPQAIDAFEPVGMVAMFYFSSNGEQIDIRYYSTVKNKWLKNSNQMRININTMN